MNDNPILNSWVFSVELKQNELDHNISNISHNTLDKEIVITIAN